MKKVDYKVLSLIILSAITIGVVVFSNMKIKEVEASKSDISSKYNEMLDKEKEDKHQSEQLTLENLSGFWIGANKKDNDVKIYHISSIGNENNIFVKSRAVTFDKDDSSSVAESVQNTRSGFHSEFLITRSSELEPSLHTVEYGEYVRGVLSSKEGTGFAKLTTGGKRDYLQIYVGENNYYHMAKLNTQDLDANRAVWSETTSKNFYKRYVVGEIGLDYGGESEKEFVEALQKHYD